MWVIPAQRSPKRRTRALVSVALGVAALCVPSAAAQDVTTTAPLLVLQDGETVRPRPHRRLPVPGLPEVVAAGSGRPVWPGPRRSRPLASARAATPRRRAVIATRASRAATSPARTTEAPTASRARGAGSTSTSRPRPVGALVVRRSTSSGRSAPSPTGSSTDTAIRARLVRKRVATEVFGHEGDWERITVLFGQDGAPSGVRYHQHDDSQPVAWSSTCRTSDGDAQCEPGGTHRWSSWPRAATPRIRRPA